MLEKIIVDADLCIKLGGSNKYQYLYEILPLVAEHIYMHTYAHREVMMPPSAVNPRKVAKALWVIAGKSKEIFDNSIWPI